MTSLESLHYAIGELAYAIARADGTIQEEERKIFHEIVTSELNNNDYGFSVSDIIFRILEKDNNIDAQTAYDWAMKVIRLNSHYLSPKLKETFIRVLEMIAESFPPITSGEFDILNKFKEDIAPLKGDPIFYEPVHA